MTKEELNDLIERRKKLLEQEYVYGKSYFYLKDFVDNHFIAKPKDFIECDIKYILKVIYFMQYTGVPTVEDANILVDDIVYPIVSKMSSSVLEHTTNLFLFICTSSESENILKYFREKSLVRSKLIAHNFILDSKVVKDLVDLKKYAEKEDMAIADLLELYLKDSLLINNLMTIYLMWSDFNRQIKDIDDVCNEIVSEEKLSRRNIKSIQNQKNKFVKNAFSEIEAINQLFKLFIETADLVRKEDKAKKDHDRNRYREIANLDQAMLLLDEGLEKQEIRDVRRIIGLIKDPEIKRAVLEIIYEHNMKYYKKLSKEFEQLNMNNSVKYQSLLNGFGLVIDSKSVEAIMYNSLEDVQAILKIISGIGYDSTTLFRILNNTDIETIKMIKSYIDRGILSDSFMLNNYDVFCSDSAKNLLLKNNILLFESYGINPNIFSNNGNILISNSLVLQNNFEVLKNYDLLVFLKTTDNYQFLIDNELLFKVERLLELGYEAFLEEDLGILNVCDIKRLEILKSLNMPVQDLEIFYSLCQSKKFFIKDDEIDNYLLNVLDFKDEVDLGINSSDLEEYRVSSRLYNINGVLVAVNKVNRLLSEGNSMYQAIFEGMILNEEEYSTVISPLMPIQYQ